MAYPTGPLLAALADRILANLDFIADRAPTSATQNQAPYEDTQLLISLLGVLVFPHERAPKALGNLLRNYPLRPVMNVIHNDHKDGDRVELTDADGEPVLIDPAVITELPRLLRNSVAHFNVLPRDDQGRFCGIRVWNRTPKPDRWITFVADIDFDELRRLARHVLTEMRKHRTDDPLEDPHDPMKEVEEQKYRERPKRNGEARHLNPEIWNDLVDAHGGDVRAARTKMDRWLKAEVKRLLADQKRGT
jgi:hypothetical protein